MLGRHLFHAVLRARQLAADAIIAVVDADVSPLRLVLGADSLAGIRAKLIAVTAEISTWESVSIGTAFEQELEAKAN